jgi:hypothetical protein
MRRLDPASVARLERPGIDAKPERERPDKQDKTDDEERSHTPMIGIGYH